MLPVNDCIIVEPLAAQDQEDGGVRTPESAFFLGKAKVVSIGSPVCVYSGQILKKTDLIPGLEIGKVVHYWKEGENRMTEDGIFRTKTSEFMYNLILPIKFIRGIDE